MKDAVNLAKQEHYKYCEGVDVKNRIGYHHKELAMCQADIICTTLTSSRNSHHKELEKIFIQ